MLARLVLLVMPVGLAGCGAFGSSGAPAGPSAAPEPAPIRLAVFTDSNSGSSTSEVRDVHDQIVRFNIANKTHELIWATDGRSFPGYAVYGNFIQAYSLCSFCAFDVRFGIRNGERRAYLTWVDNDDHDYTGNIVDIEVVDGKLVMKLTNVRVPGN